MILLFIPFSSLCFLYTAQVRDILFVSLQIAIGTDDVYKTAEGIKLFGGKITREPGPLPGINTKITACLDRDGWKSVCILKLLIYALMLVV